MKWTRTDFKEMIDGGCIRFEVDDITKYVNFYTFNLKSRSRSL